MDNMGLERSSINIDIQIDCAKNEQEAFQYPQLQRHNTWFHGNIGMNKLIQSNIETDPILLQLRK